MSAENMAGSPGSSSSPRCWRSPHDRGPGRHGYHLALEGDGPLTVFAPTGRAFGKLPDGTVQSLLEKEPLDKPAAILKEAGQAAQAYDEEVGTLRQLVSGLWVMVTMILACGLSLAAGKPTDGSEVIFPDVKGSNLAGVDFELPADFEGKLNLVIIAFQREQQELVDTWLPFAESLEDRFEGFRYYELPTIHKANVVTRWFIDNGMRRGIKDPKARATTITLYLDKKRFRRALKIPHEGTIYALLLDNTGSVVWMVNGSLSKGKKRALEDLLSKTLEVKEG